MNEERKSKLEKIIIKLIEKFASGEISFLHKNNFFTFKMSTEIENNISLSISMSGNFSICANDGRKYVECYRSENVDKLLINIEKYNNFCIDSILKKLKD